MSGMALTWLDHSTVGVEPDGARPIADPLSRHSGPLLRRRHRPEPVPADGIDVILLSHAHHAHCELRSLRKLADEPKSMCDAHGGRTDGGS